MPEVEFTPFEEVLERSDILTLHCPLTSQAHNLLGAAELRRTKPTALRINTARDGLVDNIEAFVSGHPQHVVV